MFIFSVIAIVLQSWSRGENRPERQTRSHLQLQHSPDFPPRKNVHDIDWYWMMPRKNAQSWTRPFHVMHNARAWSCYTAVSYLLYTWNWTQKIKTERYKHSQAKHHSRKVRSVSKGSLDCLAMLHTGQSMKQKQVPKSPNAATDTMLGLA